ncbi:RNA polymerase sigma factor RpoE [Paenalcaligenes faecalis]|uniref:RNA polymerase sigma factor RpoE n=1 Tax=Paenalcaligenes faecalis TaxID=2980099 RepID=UPI0022B96AE5|nr:RNA polymerase sigma factor RpoE [Paenalcaligenes faecalis]
MSHDVDLDLVRQVQQGNKRAFDLLVLKYQRRIMRLLARMINDPAEVEDVAQETFIKAYRALPQFRGDSQFYTWLYRIAINSARNWQAARHRRPLLMNEYENEDGETFSPADTLTDINTPESELVSRQVADAVKAAIDALPADLRNAILLREIEGLSYEEIAETMDCPIGTVRSRIFRAREAITEQLRQVRESSS